MPKITDETSHRPWPLPDGPWIMAQRWSDLLFAHWPVPAEALRALVPAALEVDTYGDTAWVTVAPFFLDGLHPRGLPAFPMISEFLELNVRTYVTLGDKPGVFFFSLDASSALAVAAARAWYHLPYFNASMHLARDADGTITYRCNRTHRGAPTAQFHARYRPAGDVTTSTPGSLDHFLTERYCLYAASGDRIYRAEIHHAPWPLQPAWVEIEFNSMAEAADIVLPPIPPRASYAREIEVVVWGPKVV